MLGTKFQDTRVYQEAYGEGQEEGAMGQARSLVTRQLTHKFGAIPATQLDLVNALTIEKLDALGEALLDFESLHDLTNWLENN
jgi:predicted transposase YdaD